MIKELIKLLAVFGVVGGVTIAPSLIKEKEVFEPDLDLPVVGTYENLKELVKKSNENSSKNYYYSDSIMVDRAMPMLSNMAKGSAVQESAVENESSSGSDDFSKTNVQVEGVDEADILKNDGKYLYHLINDKLIISEISPASSMEIVSTTEYNDFDPSELYIDDNMVIVVGQYYKNSKQRYYWGENYTKVIIYDAKDKANIKVVKEVEVSGNYNSSRKIEDALYFVSQKNIGYYMFDDDDYDILPLYRDTSIGIEPKKVGCENIIYFPEFECSEYLITVGVDLSNLTKEADISTYLGNSESIYSSKDNMYVTFTSYESNQSTEDDVALKKILVNSNRQQHTSIYRFKLEDGKMNCKATGRVSGSILNQFSMDESGDYFRIATTKGSVTGSGENISKNNMYVLNMKLETIGSIEDIAPGEKIYSVRFMGDRAYMVTFRKVDPLFVIDLSVPENPQILGKLKIPGYSDYLHPYDDKHILGFGKDADVVNNEDGSWGWTDENNTVAYYQGMKIAMFDVSDPENPIEMWKEEIGDRGTNSELLNNHKALLFSKEKNLLAFPISVAEVKESNAKASTYGDTTFVGAYVYEVTLETGFKLKAKLTNLTDEDWKKSGSYYYGDKAIDRLIYIGNAIYTIADSGYTAYSLNDFEKVGELIIR